MPDWNIVASAITGVVSGGLASVFAPWVNWRIEKVRARTEYRRSQIRRWREAIAAFDFDSGPFADTVIYSELRPHLDGGFRRSLESGRTVFVPAEGRGANAEKHRILDFITKAEQAWKLV
jgi:hypothetical protein